MTSDKKPVTSFASVEEDPISGELYLVFPDEIAEAVCMSEWTWVNWNVLDDGTVVISKSDRQDTGDDE